MNSYSPPDRPCVWAFDDVRITECMLACAQGSFLQSADQPPQNIRPRDVEFDGSVRSVRRLALSMCVWACRNVIGVRGCMPGSFFQPTDQRPKQIWPRDAETNEPVQPAGRPVAAVVYRCIDHFVRKMPSWHIILVNFSRV